MHGHPESITWRPKLMAVIPMALLILFSVNRIVKQAQSGDPSWVLIGLDVLVGLVFLRLACLRVTASASGLIVVNFWPIQRTRVAWSEVVGIESAHDRGGVALRLRGGKRLVLGALQLGGWGPDRDARQRVTEAVRPWYRIPPTESD